MSDRFVEFFETDVPEARQDEHWQPRTDGEAEWAILKIAEARAMIAHHEAERAKALEKWDRYVEAATREARQTEAFFTAKLQGFLLALREAGTLGRKKSYTLPSARLQLQTVQARWEPQDAQAVKAFAEACDYIKVTVEVDMTLVRQACAEGVDVPGMALARPEGEVFRVIFPKDLADDSTEE